MATSKEKADAAPALKSYVDTSSNISMEELLSGTAKSSFVPDTIVHGVIVEKRPDVALLDIGYKAEGEIPKAEFGADWETVKVGDELDVLLEETENDQNMPGISLQKAKFIKAWDKITSEYGEGSTIKGLMKHRVKGGIIIDLNGVEAFLPGSQIDIVPVKNMDDYIGKEFDLKILKINKERKNIVVSRRELLAESREDMRAKLLQEMQVGELRKGTVKNITDFGAFIDLNGVDGLLHITDMSWARITNPREMLDVGQEVEVMILDIDHEKKRVSLGLKQKTRNPWDN
ncbi:MAG: S1 RNA-binding domain-containing protein, partial [Clostridia bacterium]|nr:S1 RNA-binding domain-containing protein [Clostridia bacterium]